MTTQSAPFALDPTLRWLHTDPAMRQREAFVGVKTMQLHDNGWAPMGLYFPGGTTLAMKQVYRLDDLTPGLYWHEHTPENPHMFRGCPKVIYTFGRFEGFGELSRSEAHRHKRGRAHFELGSDTLDCDLGAHLLREDGTSTCYVNFGLPRTESNYRLWRVTHYVTMPAEALAQAGPQALGAGLTDEQGRWLAEERQLRTVESCSEYRTHAVAEGLEGGCRAVLQGEDNRNFSVLLGELPGLSPSQAKQRKSAVAITWRSYNYVGQPIGHTYYFRREDAQPLLDMLRSLADLEQAAARATTAGRALAAAATQVREVVNARIREQVQAALGQVAEVAEPHEELALAA